MRLITNAKKLGNTARNKFNKLVSARLDRFSGKLSKLTQKVEPVLKIDVEHINSSKEFRIKFVLTTAHKQFVIQLVDEDIHKAIDYALDNLFSQVIENKRRLKH